MATDHRGFQALVGSSVAIFWPGAFIFGFPGVMAPYWGRSFGVGHGPIGAIMFFVLAAVGLFMFFVGKWQNRLGIRNLVSVGAVLCSANVLVLLIADSIWWIYLWAFINGAASCFILLPTLTSVQQWFPQKRGLVSGIVNLMFGLSAAIMAPLFGILIERIGYFGMIGILGPISMLTGLVAAQFTAPPASLSIVKVPVLKTANNVPKNETMTTLQIIKTRNFRLLWFTWALQGAAGISMVTLSTGYGMARGYSLESAIFMLTAFNLASGGSRLISGYLSDKIGRNVTMSLSFGFAALAYFCLPMINSLPMLTLPAILIGFAFGTLFAVSAPLVTDCFGMINFGAVFGLVFTAYGFVAGPLGATLSGYLLDRMDGNYNVVFGYLGCFCAISAALIWSVRPTAPE